MIKWWGGFKTVKLTALCLALTVMPALCVQAQDTPEFKTLEVIGSGIIKDNDSQAARKQALADALAAAVELVVSDLLPLESRIQHFKFLHAMLAAQTPVFIQNYRIMAESEYQNNCKLLVQSTVCVARINQQLAEYGIMAGRAWREGEAKAPLKKIEIQVAGSGYSIGNFISFRRILKSIAGVEDIRTRQMQSKSAVITVAFSGNGRALALALSEKPADALSLDITDSADDHLTIELDTLKSNTLN